MKNLTSKFSLSVMANGTISRNNNPIGHKHILAWILLFTIVGFILSESPLVVGKILERDSILTKGPFSSDTKSQLIMTTYSPYSILSSSSDETFTHSLAEPGKVLPPMVNMNYNGTAYHGKLIAYEFRQTDSFTQLSPLTKELSVRDDQNGEFKNLIISPDNTITSLNQSAMEIKIENGSKMKFAITNNPSQLAPASLSILAYSQSPFEAVRILDVDDQDPTNTSFRIDLEKKGEHVLMATATWSSAFTADDQNNNISGYAIYVWPTNIV